MESQTVVNNARKVSSDNSGYVSKVDQLTLQEKIEPILRKITDEEKKKAVKEFWYTHFAEYVGILASTDFLIEKGEVTPEDAYEDIFKINEKILGEGDKLEEFINDRKIMKEIKSTFREVCGYWVYKSELVKYAYEKPRGYAGDYQIIEAIYNNIPQSNAIGYCFDKYLLEYFYSTATRARKEKIKKILNDFLQKNYSNAEILNVACGSSREIKELFMENRFDESKKIIFSLLDHDIDALFDSSEEILKNSSKNIEYKFIHSSIVNLLKDPVKYYRNFAGKDLIYSLGLLDYLSDGIIKKLILFLYSLLNPEGKLIIAHPDSKKYKPLHADWFCNWKFYLRNKREVIELINNSGIKNFSYEITEESVTKIIFFLIIIKNK